jgi:hypothetical protein
MYSGSDQGSLGATHPQLTLKQRLLRLATVTGTGRSREVCLSLKVFIGKIVSTTRTTTLV